MKTFIITKKHLDKDNFYIGSEDLTKFEGNIEAEEKLGWIKFKTSLISIGGYIYFKAGSGIKAGEGIEAGLGIEAGEGIEAGDGIKAGEGIKAGLGIKAGEGIKAGWGIEAGSGIKAGLGIEAGEGIRAGLYISCKGILSFSYKIFAGICYWRYITDDEKTITCGKKEGNGIVEYGILKETGISEEKKKIIIDGKEIEISKESFEELKKSLLN